MFGICFKILQQTKHTNKRREQGIKKTGLAKCYQLLGCVDGHVGVHKPSSLVMYVLENFHNKEILIQKSFILWKIKKKKKEQNRGKKWSGRHRVSKPGLLRVAWKNQRCLGCKWGTPSDPACKCLKGSSEVRRKDLFCAAPEDNQYWDQYRSYRKTTLGRRV